MPASIPWFVNISKLHLPSPKGFVCLMNLQGKNKREQFLLHFQTRVVFLDLKGHHSVWKLLVNCTNHFTNQIFNKGTYDLAQNMLFTLKNNYISSHFYNWLKNKLVKMNANHVQRLFSKLNVQLPLCSNHQTSFVGCSVWKSL